MEDGNKPVNAEMVDTDTIVKKAKVAVRLNESGTPIHLCGLVSHGDCPCHVCVFGECAACAATLY